MIDKCKIIKKKTSVITNPCCNKIRTGTIIVKMINNYLDVSVHKKGKGKKYIKIQLSHQSSVQDQACFSLKEQI